MWSVKSRPSPRGPVFQRLSGVVAGVEALRRSVEALGGSVEVEGGRVLLVFGRRGFALADLPPEALRELAGYREAVIVERGAGHGGFDYYYYISRGEVERLIERLRGSPGG